MEKRNNYGKFQKKGNFKKEERKITHIGDQDWYFRAMDLGEQYQKSNNWKFLSEIEYEDNFRAAKAVLKALYTNNDTLKIGWNVVNVLVDDKSEIGIRVGFGVYKTREGKLGIPLYNSVISDKYRYVGLSNLIYGINMNPETNFRRTYFKHYTNMILASSEEDAKKIWEFYERPEKIDGVKYFGNQKFTLIFMSEDYVNNKSALVHKKSSKKEIRYEKNINKPEYKKEGFKKYDKKPFVKKERTYEK